MAQVSKDGRRLNEDLHRAMNSGDAAAIRDAVRNVSAHLEGRGGAWAMDVGLGAAVLELLSTYGSDCDIIVSFFDIMFELCRIGRNLEPLGGMAVWSPVVGAMDRHVRQISLQSRGCEILELLSDHPPNI